MNKKNHQKDFVNTTIHELVEEQVMNTPHNLAVAFGDIKLTYNDLNQKANQFANYIRAKHQLKIGRCTK